MQAPLVSVIVPTYNRPHLLPRAIKSVINQKYTNFELIIVNGPSAKDNTTEVVRSFEDSRIIYFSYKKGPLGPNFKINIGLTFAKGDIIIFLGDDDELTPDALEIIVDTFTRVKPLGVEILIFDIVDVERNKLSGYGLWEEGIVRYNEILRTKGDYMLAYSKKALEGFRFPENIVGFESVALLQLFRKFLAYYVPKVIYRAYREHGPRLSQPRGEDRVKALPNALYALNLFINRYGKDLFHYCPESYWEYVGKLGFYQYLNNKRLLGLKNMLSSFIHNAMPTYKLMFALACLPPFH